MEFWVIAGGVMLVGILAIAILLRLVKRTKIKEAAQWSRSRDTLPKLTASESPGPNLWQLVDESLFFPGIADYSPEVCAHNLAITNLVLHRTAHELTPVEIELWQIFRNFLQSNQSRARPELHSQIKVVLQEVIKSRKAGKPGHIPAAVWRGLVARVQSPIPVARMSLIRLPFGPSPWAFQNRAVTIDNSKFRWRPFDPNNPHLAGITSMLNARDDVLMLLSFQCYVRILENGDALVWGHENSNQSQSLVFHRARLADLPPIQNAAQRALEMSDRKTPIVLEGHALNWKFPVRLKPGKQPIETPGDWSAFEETIVLSQYGNGEPEAANVPRSAIYVFDWRSRLVEIIPQDWFNNGNYDFGYQWIARVARTADGRIVGEGVRLGTFLLDSTGRNVERWLNEDLFHML